MMEQATLCTDIHVVHGHCEECGLEQITFAFNDEGGVCAECGRVLTRETALDAYLLMFNGSPAEAGSEAEGRLVNHICENCQSGTSIIVGKGRGYAAVRCHCGHRTLHAASELQALPVAEVFTVTATG